MTKPATPGQAAYEAACASHSNGGRQPPWGELTRAGRKRWERIAAAAIRAEPSRAAVVAIPHLGRIS